MNSGRLGVGDWVKWIRESDTRECEVWSGFCELKRSVLSIGTTATPLAHNHFLWLYELRSCELQSGCLTPVYNETNHMKLQL